MSNNGAAFDTGKPLRLEELKQIIEAMEGLDYKDLQFSGLVTVFSDIDNEFLGQLQNIPSRRTWIFYPAMQAEREL